MIGLEYQLLCLVALFTHMYGDVELVQASVANITLDDSSAQFSYQPTEAWTSGAAACPPSSDCLDVVSHAFAFDGTWHSTPASGVPAPVSVATQSSALSATTTAGTDGKHDHGEDGDGDGDDAPATMQLNFTGAALYLYSIIPSYTGTNLAQRNVSVSFMLDSSATGTFQRAIGADVQSSEFGVLVFAQTGLSEGAHILKLSIDPSSVFIFDYALVTPDSTPTASVPGAARTVTAPSTTPSSTDKKSVMSFGAVVGGIVGVLMFISFSLFINIYTRRIRSARRQRAERLERASQHNDSDTGSFHTYSDGASMRSREAGPVAFVPRFFPGTTPATPPAYASLPPAPPTFEEVVSGLNVGADGANGVPSDPISSYPPGGMGVPAILDADMPGPPAGDPPPPPLVGASGTAASAARHTLAAPVVTVNTTGRRMSLTNTQTLPPSIPPPSFVEATSTAVYIAQSLSAGTAHAHVPLGFEALAVPAATAHLSDTSFVTASPRRAEIRTIEPSRTPSPSPTDSLMHSPQDADDVR